MRLALDASHQNAKAKQNGQPRPRFHPEKEVKPDLKFLMKKCYWLCMGPFK
jgi:hypothetical protein